MNDNFRLLYLHGFASGPASKKAQFFRRRFADRGLDLDVPDLAADLENLTISGQLEVVAQALQERPAVLIGSSLGGYLAALYAARHKEVRGVVLLAPAFDFARRWEEWLGKEKMEAWRNDGFLRVYHYGQQREARVGFRLLEDAGRYEGYPSLSQPALVVHGLRDEVLPVEASRRFARGRPGVVLHTVDSDHELLDVLEFLWDETWALVEHLRSAPAG